MMTGRRWNKKKRDGISLFHQLYPYWQALKRLKTTLHAYFINIKLIVCLLDSSFIKKMCSFHIGFLIV